MRETDPKGLRDLRRQYLAHPAALPLVKPHHLIVKRPNADYTFRSSTRASSISRFDITTSHPLVWRVPVHCWTR